MSNYFEKAVVFTDSHFGRSGDSTVANQDNLDFIHWMLERARSWGAETCLFLGDYYHNRSAVGLSSMQSALEGLEAISTAGFEKVIVLLGNHDLARRADREISSLNFSRHLPGIQLMKQPMTVGDVTFLPWLVEDEHRRLSQLKSRYVFGHLETIGAMMNARVPCSGGSHAIEADDLKSQEFVFSGHFHQRQTLKNICYIGSIMPFDFSDANDDQRGMMLLEWGKQPIFESFPDQPLYRSISLSDLLDDLSVLRPRMTVRATVDIDLRYEEVQELRETLMRAYYLRKIELINHEPLEPEYTKSTSPLHTVDEIVIDGLQTLEGQMSNQRLIDIYTGLPR
jgi:DNA repair exonuclease SbcCD nuclease subunit